MILDGGTITLDTVAVNRPPDAMSANAYSTSSTSPFEATRAAPVADVCTPALLLDVATLKGNLEKMERLLAGKARLRPHAKTHKSPDIARLQMAAGAVGITTATVWEALALAEEGIPDILIANEVVGAAKLAALVQAAALAEITVAVDSEVNARHLSSVATDAGVKLGTLIDVDIGLGRCGVRSVEEAARLAEITAQLPGLTLYGVLGYEGHCTFVKGRRERALAAAEAVEQLLEAADALREAGHEITIVSAGGTGTYDMTGLTAGITEIQAGSYALMDVSHREIVSDFDFALTILATVISRHGTTIVLDAGRKTIGFDAPPPQLVNLDADLAYVAEEHSVFELRGNGPGIGDLVELIPSYCPVAVGLHDTLNVVEEGQIVERWPIVAQGSGVRHPPRPAAAHR
jgi:D-serine deaminase-like pyridoxal phosphate-dependent protein